MDKTTPATSQGRRYLVAMVLGTTLSAMGAAPSQAAVANETTVRAVSNLSRYCTACWRNARLHPDSWQDCTQEVFSRLMERVTPDSWGRLLKAESDERREFFRAIDAVKKRTQRSRKATTSLTDLVSDRNENHRQRLAGERETVRLAANRLLSDRQQRILQMSFEGWSVHEIASELKMPAERISDEKYKAIRKLREELARGEEV